MSNLPSSWITAPLGAFTLDCGQRVPEETDEFKYIDIGSINRDTKRIETPQQLLGRNAPSRARKHVLAGDVLVSMTRPNLNAVALVPDELDGQIASAFVEAMSELVQGALYPAVRPRDIRGFEAPLAPLPEQKRIADKLDAVLVRVDACRDRLDRVPAILKRFRQSVLAAATSGKLTEDWRGGDISSWAHERAADVCAKVQSGGTPKEGFTHEGIPFLKVYNIVNQKVAFDYKPQYIAPKIHQSSMSKSQVQPGDVLMNIVGPPLGKVAVVPDSHSTWNINQAITLFQPSGRISTGWLYCILSGGENIAEIVHETRGSAGQTNILLSQCRDFIFPVPPVNEQTEIVRRVEALFACADRLEACHKAARAQVEKLTPATLAKAFRGDLVPQDPNDEPASELLKRIRAQHNDKSENKRGRKNPQTS